MIDSYIQQLLITLEQVPTETIQEIVDVLRQAKKEGKRVYVMGNGGSATTASHIAGDLNKTAGLRAYSLTDSNYLITAWANDISYDAIFTRQLEGLVDEGDVVIALSGSGKSQNVSTALVSAARLGAKTIGITGFRGGNFPKAAGICLIVDSECMEQVEDIHLMIGHILVTELKAGG